jgi:hypothetical protein
VHTGGETKRICAVRNYIMRARRNMFSNLMSHSLTRKGGVTSIPQMRLPTMNGKRCLWICVMRMHALNTLAETNACVGCYRVGGLIAAGYGAMDRDAMQPLFA